ncbi:poly-beta-1,6 N-acetyl-D-glucosamine export porin PgaA [Silvimonas amylolytica]|uniref:poly-beta-1,6 N-acetyl-D-glucosamine export porin PgaA n=1 Tax=Silvimonas amylolytica TaxID=449663 RepID=UPI0016671673|nr:poly-beta-1,6 N-acetyl-D-glucosamine export porin PgaA [Silvimonas amylolytica]
MRTARCSVIELSLALLTLSTGAQAAVPADDEARYHAAIEDARSNHMAEAMNSLQALHAAYPADPRFRNDLVAVSAWAGDDAQAAATAQGLDPDTAPVYVLAAWADAEKHLQHIDTAQKLYEVLGRRDPARFDVQVSLTQLDLQRNQPGKALTRLNAVDEDVLAPRDKIALSEMFIHVHNVMGDYAQVLYWCDHLQTLDPGNRTAAEARFVASLRMSAPHLALSTTLTLKPADLAAAKTAAVQREIRWGKAEADNSRADSPTRWRLTDKAIANGQAHVVALQGPEAAGPDAIFAQQYDLVEALVNRRRMQDAVNLFQNLQQQHAPIPPWVNIPAASAWLALRQPGMAITLLEQAFAAKVGDFDAHVTYVYALLEAERPTDAIAAADQLVADTPEWRNNAYPALRVENQDYPAAQLLAAQVRAWTEQLAQAQRRVDDLHHRAPGNEDISAAQAEVDRLRGWPRLAVTRLRRLQTASPDYIWALPPLFDAHMDAPDYAAAASDLANARQQMPDDEATRRMARNWQDHLREESVSTLTVGRSGGGKEGLSNNGSSNSDVTDITFDTRFYSAPIDWNWRAYAHAGWQQSRDDVENLLRREAGAGLEYRAPVWSGEVQVDGSNGSAGLAGGHVLVSYHPTDFWTIDAGYGHNTDDTPLRAFNDGVHTDFYSAAFRYRWSESAEAGVSASNGRFSDDNSRVSWGVYGQRRLVSQPYYQMDGRIDVGGMHNTLSADNASYFNPSSQTAASVSMINRWVEWRRYERQVSHTLTLSVGDNWQQNYGGALIAAADYELDYQIDALHDWRVGASVGRAVYDGNPETDYAIHTTLDWKF